MFTKEDRAYFSFVKEIEAEVKQAVASVLESRGYTAKNAPPVEKQAQVVKGIITAMASAYAGMIRAASVDPVSAVAGIEACIQLECPEFEPRYQDKLSNSMGAAIQERGNMFLDAAKKPGAPKWIKEAVANYMAQAEEGLDDMPSEEAIAQGDLFLAQVMGKPQEDQQ